MPLHPNMIYSSFRVLGNSSTGTGFTELGIVRQAMRKRARQVEAPPRLAETLHRALIRGQGGANVDVTGAGVDIDFSGRAIADLKAVIREALAPFDVIQMLGAIVVFSVFSPG